MKLFFDTNVLIDYYAQQGTLGANAYHLTIPRFFDDARLWVSGKSFTDAFYVLKKHKDSQKLQQAMLDSLKIFDVCSLERDDIDAACKLGWPDFEDALIEISAQKVGADYLITRDAGFGYVRTKARTPVCTPEEIIAIFEKRGLTYAAIDLDRLCLD
ncbi:MAG: PIN domain-containing protein [Coriobacteriia bacterium]|nr:PIN domain-containing protein [Coriobacteriia bacterium]